MTRIMTTGVGMVTAVALVILYSISAQAAGLSLTAELICDAPTCYWDEGRCHGSGIPDRCEHFTTQEQCEAAGPSGVDQGDCRITTPICLGDICI